MLIICSTKQCPEGEGRAFEIASSNDTVLQVLIVKIRGEFYAYENRCAHFGLRLDVTPDYTFVKDDKLVCQVHYAKYDPVTGHCVHGECGNEGLRALSIFIKDDNIYLAANN